MFVILNVVMKSVMLNKIQLIFFSVRLLSVLRGNSLFLILILEKEPFSMMGAKRGNYWYDFYNVFGMTGALTGD